ncbi:hypothetical protein I7I48_05162 [Histoplasma ohiense]|nr:hypothetical protein I7I48_05162 [Histoplasma ohiense (nom. inval.)]
MYFTDILLGGYYPGGRIFVLPDGEVNEQALGIKSVQVCRGQNDTFYFCSLTLTWVFFVAYRVRDLSLEVSGPE